MPPAGGETRTGIAGRAHPAGQSRSYPARLRLDGGSARIEAEGGLVLGSCPTDALRVEPRLGTAPRRILTPDGALFETEDHDAVEAAFGRDGWSWLHAAERFHPRLVLVVAAVVGAAWALWRWGLDLIAAAAVAMTPAAAIDAIDRGALQTADLTLARPSRLAADQRVTAEAIFARLLASLDPEVRQAHAFRLEFRDLPGLGPNAIALPGGTVILSDELVRTFPAADVQAGVLAHEIGHVVERHGLHQLYRSLGIAVLVAVLAGDTVPIVEDIVLEGNVLLSLTFSRRSEAEADAFGVELAARAGYDPGGLIDFFAFIEETYGDAPSWLSSHPAGSERREAIRRRIGR